MLLSWPSFARMALEDDEIDSLRGQVVAFEVPVDVIGMTARDIFEGLAETANLAGRDLDGLSAGQAIIAARLFPPFAPFRVDVTTEVDTSARITLDAFDPNGDPIVYSIIRPPAHGTLAGSNGQLTYTPSPGFLGTDSFGWTASDGFDTVASEAWITVALSPPIAVADAYGLRQGGTIDVPTPGVLQ